jgi:hypothetical protein
MPPWINQIRGIVGVMYLKDLGDKVRRQVQRGNTWR